jgi:hypothetical protein
MPNTLNHSIYIKKPSGVSNENPFSGPGATRRTDDWPGGRPLQRSSASFSIDSLTDGFYSRNLICAAIDWFTWDLAASIRDDNRALFHGVHRRRKKQSHAKEAHPR